MSEVIYRKYRPKTFAEVFGQKPISITLQNEIISGQAAHAYLLVGPRGTGKTTLARLFARSLNCLNRKSNQAEPCNECQICRLILEGRSMDVIEIDAASHTGVDNVRENIIANAQVPPFNSKGYKVFVIDEVHMLSKSAFNALLKTLEEPPRQVIFILATTEIHKVPETIISRCQRFDLRKITQKDIVKKLAEIIEWEKIKIPDHILPEIARKAEGSMRDAESLLGQIISLGQGQVTEELASLVLPRNNWQEIDILVEALRVRNLSSALNQINKLVNEGVDLNNFSLDLIEYLRQIMLYQIIGPGFSLDFADDLVEAIKRHAVSFPLNDLSRLINIILDKLTIKEVLIDQLPLELTCVEFLLDTHDNQPTNVIKEKNTETQTKQNFTSANNSVKELRSLWPQIIEGVKPFNHSLSALLLSAHPLAIKDNHLDIGLQYDFHLEQLDKPTVKEKISQVISSLLGKKIKLSFHLDQDFKNNHNNFKGANEKEVGELLETFGGEVI